MRPFRRRYGRGRCGRGRGRRTVHVCPGRSISRTASGHGRQRETTGDCGTLRYVFHEIRSPLLQACLRASPRNHHRFLRRPVPQVAATLGDVMAWARCVFGLNLVAILRPIFSTLIEMDANYCVSGSLRVLCPRTGLPRVVRARRLGLLSIINVENPRGAGGGRRGTLTRCLVPVMLGRGWGREMNSCSSTTTKRCVVPSLGWCGGMAKPYWPAPCVKRGDFSPLSDDGEHSSSTSDSPMDAVWCYWQRLVRSAPMHQPWFSPATPPVTRSTPPTILALSMW